MDKYTATEQAFKNGYERGYNDGKPKWIPVSERLPKKPGRYLTLEPSHINPSGYTIFITWYTKDEGFHDHDPEWGYIPMENVTHWMPLPATPMEV